MSTHHRQSISASMKPSARTNVDRAQISRLVAKFTEDVTKVVDRFRRDMDAL
jgi:hypothetical protein